MPSSTSSFDFQRTVPDLPWRGLLIATLALAAGATVAWEIRARAHGYAPCLNDTSDLWADRREAVKPDSIVLVGDSRMLFDADLGVLEQGLGQRPIQLALVGSCAYPILENLANDESFHGTVIASLIPAMWLVPEPAPPYQNSLKALRRYRDRTVAHRAGHHLGMFLEEHIAFMKQDDLTLEQLLKAIDLPSRATYHAPPRLPPYFATIERDRQTFMIDAAARPGPLRDRIKHGWPPLFSPPPMPAHTPKFVFEEIAKAVEARFGQTADAVRKIRARGGKVVFVRFPHSGLLKELEDQATPREGPWTRLLAESGAPGIYYSDHPELVFDCPEDSHLSAPDATEFTKRLVPYLKQALTK
ncbi:MAG TPA: hypothetical protein VG734_27095 [Lacunisphaera sp.]|nr:hypothetical protein [Lacunisphaera sp.]